MIGLLINWLIWLIDLIDWFESLIDWWIDLVDWFDFIDWLIWILDWVIDWFGRLIWLIDLNPWLIWFDWLIDWLIWSIDLIWILDWVIEWLIDPPRDTTCWARNCLQCTQKLFKYICNFSFDTFSLLIIHWGVQAYQTCKGLYETDLYVFKSKELPCLIIFVYNFSDIYLIMRWKTHWTVWRQRMPKETPENCKRDWTISERMCSMW